MLLPLTDERGAGVECVRAWTGQTTEPGSFEILALAPGEDARLERSVRALLRDHDRWIVAPGRDEYELFNLGAETGSGEYVFVTEAHCVPEPDCLAAMLEELDRTGAPGVRGSSVPEAHGGMGEFERDAFEDALRVEEDPDHWRKVLIHSLAIRRDLYLDAGGLQPVYGDFAPWPLAIALHSDGQRLVFSPRPRVRHVYDGDLDELRSHVRSFGRGEMRFRSEVPIQVAGSYLDPAVEWEQRLEHTRAGAARPARRDRPAPAGHAARRIASCRGCCVRPAAGGGSRAAGCLARGAAGSPLTGCRECAPGIPGVLAIDEPGGRLEGLAETSLGEVSAPPPATRTDMRESLAGRSIGFFHIESFGEHTFRWTAPLAAIKVNAPGRGIARCRLELLPLQRPEGARDPGPRIAVDNRIAPAWGGPEVIEFDVPSGERWVSLACQPLRPRLHGVNDPRALGLPIRGLSFEPV